MSEIRTSRIPAKARNHRLRYGGYNASYSGGSVSGTGSSSPTYWRLASGDESGSTYTEQFIRTVYDTVIEKTNGFSQIGIMRIAEQRENNSLFISKGDGTAANMLVSGDVVAYATDEWDLSSPVASADVLGMIRIGEGLSIVDGVVSVTGGGTGGGGGLGSLVVTGTGNALTGASLSNDNTTLTLTKGSTFALSNGSNATGTWGISISGTAYTASRLQTPRTLWGQSFDGSASVSGTLTNVGHIYPSASGSYNIGSADYRFANGYYTGLRVLWGASETATATHINSGSIELYASNPYIDFHYGNSAADYTSRIIEQASGTITCYGNWLATGDVVAYSTGAGNLSSPIASTTVLGMIKVGAGLSITNGVLSATGGGTGGGGVTSVTIGGTGNAFTAASISGTVLTLTKGSTFALNSDLTTHTANTTIHITSTERTTWNSKQNALTAGTGISISGNTISATGGGTGGSSPISSVQNFNGGTGSPSQSYSSNIIARTGYMLLSGTLSANSMSSVIMYNLPTSTTLAVIPTVISLSSNNWRGMQLVANAGWDTGSSVWRITVYNPTSAAVSLDSLSVRYIALINNN